MQPRDAISARPDEESSGPAASGFEDECKALARALEKALAADDLKSFYQVFRSTSLPLLPIALREKPHTLFCRTSEVIRRLGSLSPAVALAVENHFYVLSAMATLPTAPDEPFHARRLELLEQIQANRWLVANTNSRVHGNQIAKTGTVARRNGTNFEISGRAVYMSLASEGDLIVFVTFLETGEPAIFACPLKANAGIEIGPLLFPDAMRDSDTRRVTFHDLQLDKSHLLVSGREYSDIPLITTFQLTWHQVLLAALSLGPIDRALDEGRIFLRSTRRPDGTPLAELDGMIVDMGRLAVSCRVARSSVDQAGLTLARIASQPLEHRSLNEAFELACATKYFCTGRAEAVVGAVRRMIGARLFTGGQVMERLSKEVVFGPLGGEVNAFIERRVGERMLGEQSFLKPASRRRKSKSLANVRALARARRADLKEKQSGDGARNA